LVDAPNKNSYQEDWRSFFMLDHYVALVIGLLVFLRSLVSVEIGISVALIEITLGVIGGNFLKLSPTPVFPSFWVLQGVFKIFFIFSPHKGIFSDFAY